MDGREKGKGNANGGVTSPTLRVDEEFASHADPKGAGWKETTTPVGKTLLSCWLPGPFPSEKPCPNRGDRHASRQAWNDRQDGNARLTCGSKRTPSYRWRSNRPKAHFQEAREFKHPLIRWSQKQNMKRTFAAPLLTLRFIGMCFHLQAPVRSPAIRRTGLVEESQGNAHACVWVQANVAPNRARPSPCLAKGARTRAFRGFFERLEPSAALMAATAPIPKGGRERYGWTKGHGPGESCTFGTELRRISHASSMLVVRVRS